MKITSNKYTCVSCDFYDQLEIFAMRKNQVKLIYKDELDNEKTVITYLKTITTRNKEEFLTILSGLEIRLDRVVSVDGGR